MKLKFAAMKKNKLFRYLSDKGYPISTNPQHRSIVYFEGADVSLSSIRDVANKWNDRRAVVSFNSVGDATILHNCAATTEPGLKPTLSKTAEDRGGVFRIQIGYHEEKWIMGFHKSNLKHPALVHAPGARIFGHRDANKDGLRTNDKIAEGFGINQHGTSPSFQGQNVDWFSEGCLVGQIWAYHLKFIELLKTDPRYKADKDFRFSTTIIDTSDYAKYK